MTVSPNALADKVAIVTGASGGIGKAIALELATQGATLGVVGRHRHTLAPFLASFGSTRIFEADFAEKHAVEQLADTIARQLRRVDILVHSAGAYGSGGFRDASVDQLDLLYNVNVRAPYVLTKLLLPLLAAHCGQIVFLNSTQGLSAAANVGQYAATQHALKAIADSLRQEVNPDGVRVLSVFLGRTASPLMRRIFESENRPYHPELLLQPEDVAAAVVNALALPRTAELTNIHLRPLKKSY
jgi:NADP-dependent 3-hydroxy acid dehydrogenase YdfG